MADKQADSSNSVVAFGSGTDKPASGDITGDSKLDLAVFRPSDTNW